jgi:hypothetical protein
MLGKDILVEIPATDEFTTDDEIVIFVDKVEKKDVTLITRDGKDG